MTWEQGMTNPVLQQVEPYHFDSQFTVLNSEHKHRIIEHMNEEHFEDLMGFIKAFSLLSNVGSKHHDIKLLDIYSEGFSLQVSELTPSSTQSKLHSDTYFMRFPTPLSDIEDLQYQYILLKQQADKKLHKKSIKLTEQLFHVEQGFAVTENMYRLVLTLPQGNAVSSQSLPVTEPGYAYLFDIEHNYPFSTDNSDGNVSSNSDDSDNSQSNDQSGSTTINSKRLHRYYTLRKAILDPQTGQNRAWIDVFLHGETLGSQWLAAVNLQKTVKTMREVPEKVAHLNQGQALLIADETSIPTVARLLELWQNPIPPLVIYITQQVSDQDYLNHREVNELIDDKLKILPVVIGDMDQGQPLAQLIDSTVEDYLAQHPVVIEKVWGAIETSTSKALRALLKRRLKLDRTDMIVKGYWRKE